MFVLKNRKATLTLLLVVSIGLMPVAAIAGEPTGLYKAYFLEREAKDYATAKSLYDGVLDGKVGPEAKRQAQAGSARCRDHIAAEDFAKLMPPDSLAYFEITRPGQLIEELMNMLGLTGKDMQEVLARRPGVESTLPFHIPKGIIISPEVFKSLGSFGGMAVAITGFSPDSDAPPSGVMVIHHGDMTLLKGILETAFQFAPTAEKIKGMPTFGTVVPEVGKVSGVLTESLLIVGTGRELVEGVVDRLIGTGVPSLGNREDLAEIAAERVGSTLFGYVDIQAALKIAKGAMSERDLQEMAMANAIADLDSFRWATFSAGAHDGQLGFQFALRLADDHHSIAYNLMRLPPMQRKCLERVPSNAAGLFGFGLNPVLTSTVADVARSANGDITVTGFDIGREFFGNIQEICAFIVPGKMIKPNGRGGPPVIPNIGIVLAVNDVQKSKALWDQFLSIPGLVAGSEPVPPKELKIGSIPVTAYSIPDFGKIYMTQLDGCVVIGSTRTAMKSVIKAHAKEKSILDDPVMGKIIANMPKDSSIMFAAHVGRLAEVATGVGDPALAMGASQAAEFCANMVVWAGLGQSPNQLTFRAAVSGLPDLNKILEKYHPMISGAAGMAVRQEGFGMQERIHEQDDADDDEENGDDDEGDEYDDDEDEVL